MPANSTPREPPGSSLLALALSEDKDGVCFGVRVVPRASRTRIQGLVGDCLKVSLTSPPVDGAANAALTALLAKQLGVPRSQVQITSGLQSRTKRVCVCGLSQVEIRERLS